MAFPKGRNFAYPRMRALEKEKVERGLNGLSGSRKNRLFGFCVILLDALREAMRSISLQNPNRSEMIRRRAGILDNGAEMAFNLRSWQSAYQPVHQSTISKEQQGRDALNAVLRGDQSIFIYIQFCDLQPACVFRCQLFYERRDYPTGATPGGPTVH
jgi:GAF domain-containing protein